MDRHKHADLGDEYDFDLAGASSSLLPHYEATQRESSAMSLTTGGKFRAYYLGVVVCIGGFLCTCREKAGMVKC